MKVTVNKYVNVRVGNPKLNAPCYQYLAPGSELEVEEVLYKGDFFDGINQWYKDAAGNYYWSGGVLTPNIANDILISNSDYFSDYRIKKFWEKGIDGSGVNIAIIDDGFLLTHPALQDFNIRSHIGASTSTNNLHGTYMASILGGKNYSSGFFGIAPNASYSLFSLGNIRDLTFSDFYSIMNQLKEFDIISISINKEKGVFGKSENQIKINHLTETILQNTFVCTSAGNHYGINTETYPAGYQNIYATIGSGSNDTVLFPDSNFPLKDNLFLLSNHYAGYYNSEIGRKQFNPFFGTAISPDGTSSATAFMAGLMALIICFQKKAGLEINKPAIFNQYFDYKEITNESGAVIGKARIINKENFFLIIN